MPLPVYVLTVDGVSQVIQFDDFSLNETVNGRNTLTCSIVSNGGAYRPALGAEIILTEDGTRIFGGNIDTPTEEGFGGIGWADIVTHISAVDFNALADRRFVIMDIGATNTLGALQALSAAGFFPTGVTLNPSQGAGSALPALSYTWRNLTDVLNEIATLSDGMIWEIDYNKVLTLYAPGARNAPYNIVTGDGHAIGDIQVKPSLIDYGNRVILRFSASAQSSYAFLKVVSGNFADGDEVEIGSRTYTFRTTLVGDDADEVAIGANGEVSLDNLWSAIMHAGGSGYAPSTAVHDKVFAVMFGPVMKVQASTPGAAGNSIDVSTTAANALWFGEGNIPLDTLMRGSDVSLSNFVQSNDLVAQGVKGLWEKIIDAEQVFDYGTAQALADAYLLQAKNTAKTVTYRTWLRGLHPGQVQTITAATRGINGTFLITDVRARNLSHEVIESEVTAVEGDAVISTWRDVFRQWSGSGSRGSTASAALPPPPFPTQLRDSRFLGGGATEWVQSAVPTWVPASAVQVTLNPTARGTDAATVRLRMRASAGTVQARLQNVSDNLTVGTSAVVGTTDWSSITFNVTLTPGTKTYELQLLPSLADTDVAAVGNLE